MEDVVERYAALAEWFELLELITVIFIPLAMLELVWDRYAGCGRRVGQTVLNTVIAIVHEVASHGALAFGIVAGWFFISPLALFEFAMNPTMWLVALLLADLTYYWMHRIEHEVRFFWAYHVVHHSSPEFNLSTAFRLSWVEGMVEWIFFIPMLLLGFDIVTVLLSLGIVVGYQTWLHTTKIGSLGVLDKIFNTPSAHRVHHGSNPDYTDKNYGGILLVWDHLFGTYQEEREKAVFGLVTPQPSLNPLTVNFHEYGAIASDIAAARSWSDAGRAMFGRPSHMASAPPAYNFGSSLSKKDTLTHA